MKAVHVLVEGDRGEDVLSVDVLRVRDTDRGADEGKGMRGEGRGGEGRGE